MCIHLSVCQVASKRNKVYDPDTTTAFLPPIPDTSLLEGKKETFIEEYSTIDPQTTWI